MKTKISISVKPTFSMDKIIDSYKRQVEHDAIMRNRVKKDVAK